MSDTDASAAAMAEPVPEPETTSSTTTADADVDVAAVNTEPAAEAPTEAPAAAAPETDAAVENEADDTRAAGGYDPSVPADEMESGGYDPSRPADEMTGGVSGGYDPSAPADEMDMAHAGGGYDPSVPADEMHAAGGGGYDPSVPADEMDHAPSMGAGGYDPSMPAGGDADAEGEQDDHHAPTNAYDSEPATAPTGVLPQAEVYEPIGAGALALEVEPAAEADVEMKVGIPEGLTEESPSVVANPQLIRQYRQYPSEPSYQLALFNWSIQKTEIVDARAWYEVLAVDNPTATEPMLALINLELALSNFAQVEALFARALSSSTTLMAAADVNIWKAYLHYIRRQNPSDGPDAEKARATVIQAYEYALKECGVDRESGELWNEYIHYVAEPKSKNPWDIQQQNDTLRKLYQRATAIPLNNVELLWKGYDAFESLQNKATAKKFLADRSPAYMTARTALREMRALTDILPFPIIPPKPKYTDLERRIVAGWRAFIKWEESNPLNTDDEALVVQRTSYALKKCLAQMRHYPEMWHYAASYHLSNGRTEEGAAFLKAGVAACPDSFLLTFALAEIEEDRKNYVECHNIFQALIKILDTEIEQLTEQVAAEVEVARGPAIPLASDPDFDNTEDSDVGRLVREREERGKLVQERRGKDIEEVKTALGVVWVMYMRFARRAEGLKAARLVFGKARKSAHPTWHIFEASALMEYHSNKDQAVAVRIFEFGLKIFSEDVNFVMSYLNFLLSINDDTNARALFERSALKISPEKARPLWDAWARFEYMYGDLPAVHKLESRFKEAFPKETPLKRFASRYTFNGIDEIALRDLGVGRVRPAPTPAPAAPGAALPPFPPTGAVRPASPVRNSPQKRPLSPPRSPARVDAFKRARGVSPPRPAFQPPHAGRFAPPNRDVSPFPAARPPVPVAGRVPPAGPTAHAANPGGLPQALSWFIGRLPTTRSFDGPIFRADDIIGLFSNIGANGAGVPAGPAAVSHAPVRPPVGGRPGGFRGPGRRY